MDKPLISIIVCTYNRGHLLKQTMESIFSGHKFMPKDEYVLATLIYKAKDGKRKRYQVKLTSRC